MNNIDTDSCLSRRSVTRRSAEWVELIAILYAPASGGKQASCERNWRCGGSITLFEGEIF